MASKKAPSRKKSLGYYAKVKKGKGTGKKAGGGMPKMPKYRDGGAFRGCGAQVKGKKFKGIF